LRLGGSAVCFEEFSQLFEIQHGGSIVDRKSRIANAEWRARRDSNAGPSA
jgi:hypothetical protein